MMLDCCLCASSQPWHWMQDEAAPASPGPDGLCLNSEVRAGLMRTGDEGDITGSPGSLRFSDRF